MANKQADQVIVRTQVGRAVHATGRQPIVPTQKTGLGAAYTGQVSAVSIRNPFQRLVPRVK